MITKKFMPTLHIHFHSMSEAYDLYETYAMLFGFSMRKNRKRNGGRAQDFECSFADKTTHSRGSDLDHGKTSKKKECKAMVCAMNTRDWVVFFLKVSTRAQPYPH